GPARSALLPSTSPFRSRTVGDGVARSRLVALLDEVPGLERVTENSSGVVWRVSTAEVTPARAALIGADGVATPVPAEVVGVDEQDRKSTRLNSSHVKIS